MDTVQRRKIYSYPKIQGKNNMLSCTVWEWIKKYAYILVHITRIVIKKKDGKSGYVQFVSYL